MHVLKVWSLVLVLVLLSGCGPASQRINCSVYGLNCPQETKKG
jgi:hypothetical protein